ncbi:tail fiber assembly protein [Kluyvera sp. STS39-E]|uniref:tail fiber assembly protein n=1 Tax=Kluyvera sp. STS39-E TaxID=3234748 RepID=UPI0034C5E1C5
MIIYVSTDNYRSISYSPIPGWETIQVEVPDNFSGGNKTYNPETGNWITDPPYVPTHEDYVREAESERQRLIDSANTVMEDWIIDLQLGVISDDDRAKLLAWRQYVKDVKAVDTSSAPNVIWPDTPE